MTPNGHIIISVNIISISLSRQW